MMKKVYLKVKHDMTINKYGLIEGELLTFPQANRIGVKDGDMKWFDMVECDTKDTYIMFGVRKLNKTAQRRILTADEREKYL